MKTSSEDLFQLIHALTKSEKRSFKLFAAMDSKEKQYISLFDLVAEQKRYDEESIVKNLGVSKSAFAVYKNHLYNLLLQKTASMHSGKETEIRNLLTQADYLYSKGLYPLYEKALRKAKKLAAELDSDTHLFEILGMEHQNSWRKRDLQGAERAMIEDKQVLHLFNNKHQYRHLSNEIILALSRTGDGRNRKEATKIKSLMKHPLIRNEKNALTFRSRNSLYHTLSLYHSVNRDIQKQYAYAKKAVDQYLAHPEKIKYDTFTYLLAVHLMLVACHSLEKFDEGKKYVDMLRIDPSLLRNEREKTWAFFTYYDTNLHYYLKTGRYAEGVPSAEELMRELEASPPKLEDSQVTVLYSHMAKIFFGSGNFSKSLLLLNKVLNGNYALNARPGFESSIKLLYLLVHYEKGNYNLLHSLVRSTRNHLSSKGVLYDFENTLLNFMARKISPDKTEGSVKSFRKLKAELESVIKEKGEAMPYEEFDFLSWAESKVQKKPFAEIARKKAMQ